MSESEANRVNGLSFKQIKDEIGSMKEDMDLFGQRVGPKLELIKPYLKRLIELQMSMPVLRKFLAEVGIKCSYKHLREHLIRIFPIEYEIFYSRKKPLKSSAVTVDPQPPRKNRKSDSGKMDVGELLQNVRDYRGTGV